MHDREGGGILPQVGVPCNGENTKGCSVHDDPDLYGNISCCWMMLYGFVRMTILPEGEIKIIKNLRSHLFFQFSRFTIFRHASLIGGTTYSNIFFFVT